MTHTREQIQDAYEAYIQGDDNGHRHVIKAVLREAMSADLVPTALPDKKGDHWKVTKIGSMTVFEDKRKRALKNINERAEKCGNSKEEWFDIQGIEVDTVETIRALLKTPSCICLRSNAISETQTDLCTVDETLITSQKPDVEAQEALAIFDECMNYGDILGKAPNAIYRCFVHFKKAEKIRRALTANKPNVPDGWVMVPLEPTHDMVTAAIEAWTERIQARIENGTMLHPPNDKGAPHIANYKAMIAAAPAVKDNKNDQRSI